MTSGRLLLVLVPVWAASLYLLYRRYQGCLADLRAERLNVQRRTELHESTTLALAAAIDAKDQRTPRHLHRVQTYVLGMARALGMAEPEIEGLRIAALLHDIGKLAVPDHILAKPGPLTPEEYAKVRVHPQVAADIIASVPFPYPVAPLILSHHERWDGRGYPAGLKGEQIPLGARILCVADYFEALTTDRPYHAALSVEAAEALIVHNAGKAFDPRVVDAFSKELPNMRAQVHRDEHHRSAARRTAAAVFGDISLAHREIYALYQIAQTMGTGLGLADTMALVAPKLTSLIPFSACALFIRVDASDTLRCRFATGIDADLIERLSLRNGNGLTGWVGRDRHDLADQVTGPLSEANVTTALQSSLVCPLLFDDHFIGMLALYHTETNFYGDNHRRLLDRVCEQAAAVVHNAMVFEQTQEDSLTDQLTGLPNTRFMRTHLGRELSRSARVKAEVSMIVLDLNGFKAINDRFGHHAGDQALREVAAVLRDTVRPYDICVRYAGDEFVVILSDCGREDAEDKREELQRAVESIAFEPLPGERLPLSISAGTAVFPHDGTTYESLLAEADRKMYENKSRAHERARVTPTSADGSRDETSPELTTPTLH